MVELPCFDKQAEGNLDYDDDERKMCMFFTLLVPTSFIP